jgi:hypothetical protein
MKVLEGRTMVLVHKRNEELYHYCQSNQTRPEDAILLSI